MWKEACTRVVWLYPLEHVDHSIILIMDFQSWGSTATDLLTLLFTQHKSIRDFPLSTVSLYHCITCQDGGQIPSRGPPRCGISWNAYQICHHENNHCYSHWMCSAWEVGQTTPFSGRGSRNAAEHDPRPNTLQLNTDGLTDNKISVIEQLAFKNKAFIIVLQETHRITEDKLVIPSFSVAGPILSRNHGLAKFVHERLECSLVDQSPDQSETEWLCVDVAGKQIINIYKPPRSRLTPATIPTFPQPSLHVGDFNCQDVNRGCNTTSPDGESLDSWATFNNVGLLYSPKESASFFSHRWNVGTNPDLAFASFGQDSQLLDRRVLGNFPRSQHRPSLITPPRFNIPAHSDPVKPWNFRKADWKRLFLLKEGSVERLPPPDTPDIERAYQDFCESLLSAAKQCVPLGRRKNYVPCWDKECETLYRSFIRAPVDCLWQSHLVPALSITTEEAGAIGGNCQLHRFLALQPQGVENN